jgi:hypothetical protein
MLDSDLNPHTSSLRDVVQTLDRPDHYLRGVLGNMILCRKEHSSANVRIGTTGRGIAPHYRIEPDDLTLTEWFDDATDLSAFFRAYHGRSHKLLGWSQGELKHDSWSRSSMSFDEVQQLIGELRGFKPRTKNA